MKKFLVFLLGLLGFTACENGGSWGDAPVEYGAPNVDYIIKGKVTNEAGDPIKGIQVVPSEEYYQEPINLLTGEDGSFVVERNVSSIRGTIVLTDIDGEENGGLYKEKKVQIASFPKEQIKGGDGKWYNGAYEITANIELEEDK